MSSNQSIPGAVYPNEISGNPLQAPSSSTAQKPPPNLDPQMGRHEEQTNPVKKASSGGAVSEGTSSVGKEGEHGIGEVGGRPEDAETGKKSSGPIDKVKEKLGQ